MDPYGTWTISLDDKGNVVATAEPGDSLNSLDKGLGIDGSKESPDGVEAGSAVNITGKLPQHVQDMLKEQGASGPSGAYNCAAFALTVTDPKALDAAVAEAEKSLEAQKANILKQPNGQAIYDKLLADLKARKLQVYCPNATGAGPSVFISRRKKADGSWEYFWVVNRTSKAIGAMFADLGLKPTDLASCKPGAVIVFPHPTLPEDDPRHMAHCGVVLYRGEGRVYTIAKRDPTGPLEVKTPDADTAGVSQGKPPSVVQK